MKKYLKTTMVVLGLGLLCFLGYKIVTKINYKSEVAEKLKTIPDFSFRTLENQPFTQDDLQKDTATAFIYFNSGCDYCQHEAKSIKKHIKEFTNTQLIFVSDESIDQIRDFAKQYKLYTYDHITFLSDPRDDFTTRFDATSVPFILIYDKKQRLVKKHKGQLKAEKLLALVSKSN